MHSSFRKRYHGEKNKSEPITAEEFKTVVASSVCSTFDHGGFKQKDLAAAAMCLKKNGAVPSGVVTPDFIDLLNYEWERTAQLLKFDTAEPSDPKERAQRIFKCFYKHAQQAEALLSTHYAAHFVKWAEEIDHAIEAKYHPNRGELIAKIAIFGVAQKYQAAGVLNFSRALSGLPSNDGRWNWTHIAHGKDNATLLEYADIINEARDLVDSKIYGKETTPENYSSTYNRRDFCTNLAAAGAAAFTLPDVFASLGFDKERVMIAGALTAGAGIAYDRWLHNVALEKMDAELNSAVRMLAGVIKSGYLLGLPERKAADRASSRVL